jgi:PleD family two-component response regulator
MSRPANDGLPDMASSDPVSEKKRSITLFPKQDRRALRLVAATSDLFLRSRITELAKQTGADPYFGTEPDELKRLVAEKRPELVILDLSSTDYDPFSVARELKTTFNSRLFGLFPHVRTELKKRADEIGFEYVVPNSSFLPSLRRVLLERAEDD